MPVRTRDQLREIWRVLAAGGRVILVVPNRAGIWARTEATPFGHGLEMLTVEIPRAQSQDEVRETLLRLTNPQKGTVLRAKGRVEVEGRWVDVSWVEGVLEFEPVSGPLSGQESGRGQLVLIGRFQTKEEIQDGSATSAL